MRDVLNWQAQAAGIEPTNLDPLGRGRPAETA
jgi:uroporphyrin-III C-methyltransferase